jgi:hypothetical protein
VRNFLANQAGDATVLPGGDEVNRRYNRFRADLPAMCAHAQWNPKKLTFGDFSSIIVRWLKSNPSGI